MPFMSKPIVEAVLSTPDGARVTVQALVDSGSFYTIVRESMLPPQAARFPVRVPMRLGTAGRDGTLQVVSETILEVTLCGKTIRIPAFLSPDLRREMLIGAGAMQDWEIAIANDNGRTRVVVGRDVNDPEVTEVD